MISLIVCSRTKELAKRLVDNIEQTAGVAYEWVVIDNSRNEKSIFQAYNEGVRRAKGDLLCFMHDDVEFVTANWGPLIEAHFASNPDVGIIGFAGAHFVPDAALYWSALPYISEHHQNNDHGIVMDWIFTDFFDGKLADVVECDGMCMFIPQKLFAAGLRFDEEYYHGFHAYDIDISMQAIAAGYRVCVCRDVMLMHHYSERTAAKKKGMELLFPNLVLFRKKWEHMLPITRGITLADDTIYRLNNLCKNAADSRVARNSASYRLGNALLKPIKWSLHTIRRIL